MQVESDGDNYLVSCPHRQTVQAVRTRTRWKAEFDLAMCLGCPLAGKCPATEGKTVRRWYFSDTQADRQRRWRRWQALPDERKKLRPNVEATIRQMQGASGGRKLKVRGAFQTHSYALLRASAVNFGRIARFLADPLTEASLQSLATSFLKIILGWIAYLTFRQVQNTTKCKIL